MPRGKQDTESEVNYIGYGRLSKTGNGVNFNIDLEDEDGNVPFKVSKTKDGRDVVYFSISRERLSSMLDMTPGDDKAWAGLAQFKN